MTYQSSLLALYYSSWTNEIPSLASMLQIPAVECRCSACGVYRTNRAPSKRLIVVLLHCWSSIGEISLVSPFAACRADSEPD